MRSRALPFPPRRGALAALIVLVSLAAAPVARSDHDIARLVMGRTTYPAGSWALDTYSEYTTPRLEDAGLDVMRFEGELECGARDRLTLATGLRSSSARRDLVRLDRMALEARYRVLDRPFQFAPAIQCAPSLRGEPVAWEGGFEALKNWRNISLLMNYAAELEREPGGERQLMHGVQLGPFYRCGLQGAAGMQWVHEHPDVNLLNLLLGGAVAKGLFISVEPHFGLSRSAPDFGFRVQIHLYRGPYAVGSWLFE